MPIIYSYPIINTVNNADMFVISKSPTDPAVDEWETKSLTANNLASYVTARVNLNFGGDTGTAVVNLDTQSLSIEGTANEIETVATQGNSRGILTIGLTDSVTITSNLSVGTGLANGNLTVGGSGSQSQIAGYLDLTEVFVNDTLEVDGDTTLNNDLDVGGNAQIGGSLDMTLSRINNVANPLAAQDAATKSYVDNAVTGLLEFKGTFRADSGLILSGTNAGAYIYNCPGGAGTRVAIAVGDYYIVANTGGQFYCSGDLLQVGDSIVASQDAAADSSTVNDWGILEGDNIEGTGLANTVPLWTDSQVLGNSNITQNLGGSITISENLLVDQKEIEAGTMIINGVAEITGELDKAGSKIVGLADPTAAQDAATKAYVDASGVNGTGTTNTLPLWSDGPAGVLSDSPVIYDPTGHAGAPTVDIVLPSQTFEFRDAGRFITGAMSAGNTFNNATLDVTGDANGKAATFRGGVIISTNPGGVQVDNTSMVIGGGNNDNVSGSDHCLIVGNGNQITNNSDQSVAFGQGNTITNSNDAFAVGNSNTLASSLRTQALGFNNTIQASSSFIAGGDNNISTSNSNIMVLGYDNSLPSVNTAGGVYIVGGNNQPFGSLQLRESFGIGNNLTLRQNMMTLGYRNNASGYPATNKNLGLGETKFVVGVGSSTITDANALIITEGGINGGSSGSVPQIPRIIFPSVVGFNFADDTAAAAGGIPVGGLYHNAGALRIRLT